MKTIKTLLIPCLLLLTTAGALAQPPVKAQSHTAAAQKKAPRLPQFFRLTFVLKELNGKKVIDTRSYRTEISATPFGQMRAHLWDPHRSIRAGDRVPSSNKPGMQFQYMSLGTKIDCSRPWLIGHQLAMQVTASISSVIKPAPDNSSTHASTHSAHPILQDNRWNSEILIPIGQQTLLFSSQAPASTHTLELDLTATPIH